LGGLGLDGDGRHDDGRGLAGGGGRRHARVDGGRLGGSRLGGSRLGGSRLGAGAWIRIVRVAIYRVTLGSHHESVIPATFLALTTIGDMARARVMKLGSNDRTRAELTRRACRRHTLTFHP
ncbi:MAG: hypothetical protein ACRDOL_39210, partial [Streptosporangiaceae bacterium]